MSRLQHVKYLAAHVDGTWEALSAADMAHLALVVRLNKGVEATNCQAERSISAHSLSIGFKIEQVILFRLNREIVQEIKENKAFKKAQQLYGEHAAVP